MFVAVFVGYNQYWQDGFMVFVVLCSGALIVIDFVTSLFVCFICLI